MSALIKVTPRYSLDAWKVPQEKWEQVESGLWVARCTWQENGSTKVENGYWVRSDEHEVMTCDFTPETSVKRLKQLVVQAAIKALDGGSNE